MVALQKDAIANAYRMDETKAVEDLLAYVESHSLNYGSIQDTARTLITQVRATPRKTVTIENFLSEFRLTTKEGIALMCLAEALLRVPDSQTANALIKDKLTSATWDHTGDEANDLFLSLSSWALMLSGKIMEDNKGIMGESSKNILGKMVKRMGEPVIRQAMLQAMKILGQQFVMGQTIEEALKRGTDMEAKGFRYSYDMLGEGARGWADAKRYLKTYSDAIDTIGEAANKTKPEGTPYSRSGISIKLSALHPRYEYMKKETCVKELTTILKDLALKCQKYNIGLTVDAEETERLDLSLDIIKNVFLDPDLKDWEGFGLALQAYQKRAFYVIDYLKELCVQAGKKLSVRLVKGAYWDSEIKKAQVDGESAYPVFTRKSLTDLSYNACAIKLLKNNTHFYTQLATHNAYTAATILHLVKQEKVDLFEFQRLHGMGEPLYHAIFDHYQCASRIYAPVGTHKDLLPYLVRRMLENGANSSFVYQITDEKTPIDDLIVPPEKIIKGYNSIPHSKIPLPANIYEPTRANSKGYDLEEETHLNHLTKQVQSYQKKSYKIHSLGAGIKPHKEDETVAISNPADPKHSLGTLTLCGVETVKEAIETAKNSFNAWSHTPAKERAAILRKIAHLYEENRDELIALCLFEAGKTYKDCVDEVREAVDFCYYYANQGEAIFGEPIKLPSPTGEDNFLSYHGRGVWACISPWNFPLAIFTGQVVAALMAGNTVLAKPAEQTSLVAHRAVELMYEAGIPKTVLHLLLGKGSVVGPILTADERIAGFAFTGSTGVGKRLQREIAAREGAIIPLIAETGGQNAMIVDNTALPEQVVDAVIQSAFYSAGQRCSALRVLYVQDEIADSLIPMLKEAMSCLTVDVPENPATDIGPVIDQKALTSLNEHIERMKKEATLLHVLKTPETGSFCAPHLFELTNIDQLTHEVFGPVLHIIRYKGDDLKQVIADINNTGFGLTLGIHTRIDFAYHDIADHIHVGNAYVNRSMTGAIVGVQPFGGEGLSGTGPKAGGPTYLYRFATERTLTINTTAAGGNTSLVSLADD